ncbi:hypothetical protein [Mycobacterium sp. NPDC050441]|uniref:hypothetical protein n=1 Tax=Mycobacterium sp. NPDC050441 TaxID=3155403 RepID=UPI0033E8B3B8
MTTFANITVKTAVGAGFCLTAVVAAMTLSPHAAALPLKTGGYKCVDGAAAPGAPCAAPAVEAAGIAPAAVPPVPLAPPPVAPPPVPLAPPPPIVPPVPLAPPPVPVVPAAAPVPAAPAPIAAPVVIAAGTATGKGVPTVSPGGGPVAGTPTLPGPAEGAAG